jgi:putative DNA methylase
MAKTELEVKPAVGLSFIESQFPVSKISKESYKERKANHSQTLTGLGKWWGRKPLILVRAAIIGLLMPASKDPQRDRYIFLKILTMDEEGLWRRKSKAISQKTLYDRLTRSERTEWFDLNGSGKPKLKSKKKGDRDELQALVFSRMSYDEKLEYCDRPEQIEGPSEEAWADINAHLETHANSLPELVRELGERQFGHVPRVGDAFCGGGSVPFEAARIGCEAYGSDLNPVAALLTWASLNIAGGGREVVDEVRKAQRNVYEAVDRQITKWGIEHNEKGWRGDAYLYCVETRCPECGWMVPIAPSWIIGEKTRTVAKLRPDRCNKRFDIDIACGVSEKEIKTAKEGGTVKDSSLVCPNPDCLQSTPIAMLRGDGRGNGSSEYGLRQWENNDVVPHSNDIFQERLYCIRWVETIEGPQGTTHIERHYCAPDKNDLRREARVLELLMERFEGWQRLGYLPNRRIEPGEKTDEPIRTRGWTHWHHLFTPRQLLTLGTFLKEASGAKSKSSRVEALLELGRLIETKGVGCRLLRWNAHPSKEMHASVFSTQAFGTLSNYCHRSIASTQPNREASGLLRGTYDCAVQDARNVEWHADAWVTDPPYADAVNYHELSEFFLAWYGNSISELLPNWYVDSKRALAVVGHSESFRNSMIDCYRALTGFMAENGSQIVMFTHQDAAVWADLALILWSAGLRVSAAWCISTETDTSLRDGNYVQGTVLLILRKQTSTEVPFLDEIIPRVEDEVCAQLESMLRLDERDDPNFGDTDYQLAAYAAALRVLTSYQRIEEIDVTYELSKARKKGDPSPIEKLITDAVSIACNYLVPAGFNYTTWKDLTAEERFYLKGLDLESHKEFRTSAYMELARGFGVRDYKPFLSNGKANQTRLKTASEFGGRLLSDGGFGVSLVRLALFAVREALISGDAQSGRNWLKGEVSNYWARRKTMIEVLRYLASLELKVERWKGDGHAAALVAGALENESV